MFRLVQIFALLLISTMTFAQVQLDSSQYFMVRKNKNHQFWLYLGKKGQNQDTLITGHTTPGSYALSAGNLLYTFTLGKTGLLNDTVIQVRQYPATGDSTVMLVRQALITKTQYYQNSVISAEILYMPHSQIIRSFSRGKLNNSMEMQLVNGQPLYITTAYYANGNKYQVNDQVKNVDSFFHENGKLKEINDQSTESVKKFNEKGILVSHVYRKELKDQIPSYSMYEDVFEGNQLVRRHIRTFENQETILKYRNGRVYEKQVRTIAERTAEEIVELYNAQGKKIKEFRLPRPRPEIKEAQPPMNNR